MKNLSELIKKDLPSLPSNFSYLMNTLNNQDISINEVIECLGQFPDITARIMLLANSAWMSPTDPIESLSIACQRIGLNIIRSISIAVSLASTFNSVAHCKQFDPNRFWVHTLMTADVTVMLAKREQISIATSSVHTAGVMRNIGLLWLAGHFYLETSQSLAESPVLPDLALSQRLKTRIGFDHHQIGGHLAKYWRLPPLNTSIMADASAENSDPQINALLVIFRLSSQLVTLIQLNKGEKLDDNLCSIIKISPDDYDYLISKLQQTEALVKLLF